MFHNYFTSCYGSFGGAGGLLSLLFWILIIWLIVAAVRSMVHGGHRHHRRYRGYHYEDSALMSLRERYARGDITREEYDERRSVLEERY